VHRHTDQQQQQQEQEQEQQQQQQQLHDKQQQPPKSSDAVADMRGTKEARMPPPCLQGHWVGVWANNCGEWLTWSAGVEEGKHAFTIALALFGKGCHEGLTFQALARKLKFANPAHLPCLPRMQCLLPTLHPTLPWPV